MVFSSLQLNAKVTKETVDSVTMFYAGGEYDKCISIAKAHEREYSFSSHDREQKYKLLIYGALSCRAKLFSFQDLDNKVYHDMIVWGMSACDFFDKWLKDKLDYSTSSEIAAGEYFNNLEIAQSGYSVISDEMDGITKRYDKLSSKWVKQAHNKFYKIRGQWSDYPVIQLMILNNAIVYFVEKNKGFSKLPVNILDEYWNAVDALVSMSEATGDSWYTSVIANSYVRALYDSFLNDIHSKNPNYIASLDVMLKSRDFILFSRGAMQYRDFKNASFKTIQNSLDDGEYCMEHFESHTAEGMFYARWDATSRRRNYAFVFDNKMDEPSLWHRGYINNIEKQGFEGVVKDYPDCKRVYSTGTDYMSLKDFVRNNSMIHRCHSLTHIKDVAHPYTQYFTFIGLIDFGNNSQTASDSIMTKGLVRTNQFANFSTDEALFTSLKELNYKSFNPLIGNQVSKSNFIASLKISQIVHISTHGTFSESDLSRMNENELGLDVINGSNILKNCKLILSGYNKNQNQFISGDEIRSLNLSNIELLFLDACQTGDGRRIGLGSYSLADAFHIAGVKNIIATLDPIDPQITQKFSLKFYESLKQGNSIHDSFYATKSAICPNERIILWE